MLLPKVAATSSRVTKGHGMGLRRTSLFLSILAFAGALGIALASAQAPQHRVVIELTSDDPKVWEALLNNVDNLKKALYPISIEVVTHGKGLQLLVPAKVGTLAVRAQHSASQGVVFAACQNTMRAHKLSVKDLVPWATPVDSGVSELVRKQEAGWSYLHSGF